MVYALKKDFAKAKHWLNLATYVPEPVTTLISTPRDLKIRALEVNYNILLNEGNLKQATESAKMLCEIMPNEPRFKVRLQEIESIFAANQASQSIVYLGKYLEQIKETEKVPYLVQAIPRDLQMERFASEMRHRFNPARIWKDNEIAILCGPGFEQWSPKSIETGIGGSEEAIIYMSQELTKLGYKVTVYANPEQEAGDHNGVTYKMWHDMNIKDRFNILILWRQIGFIDFNPRARFKMLWCHDMPLNPELTEERINKLDKIAVLSEFHKGQFRMQKTDGTFEKIPDEKFFLTANGINI